MRFALVRTDTSETVLIGPDPIFVGSAEWKVDLCLSGNGIDEVQCELAANAHGIRTESLCDAGVLVNGQPVQSALLFVNDRLTVGEFEFCVDRANSDSHGPVRELPAKFFAGAFVDLSDDASHTANNSGTTTESAKPEHTAEAQQTVPPQIDHNADQRDEPTQAELTDEPQYFVLRDSTEDGPFPRRAVQDLIGRGELSPDAPVRLEWNPQWTNAIDLGFAFPATTTLATAATESTNTKSTEDALAVAADSGAEIRKTRTPERSRHITAAALAPFYLVETLFKPLREFSWKQSVILLLACVTIGFAAKRVLTQYARTAITGRVLLNQAPLSDVIVTFNGMSTGEAAAATTDAHGRFRLLTLTGELPPGRYRITVRPRDNTDALAAQENTASPIPDHYVRLATSSLTVEVTPDQTEYQIALTTTYGASRG